MPFGVEVAPRTQLPATTIAMRLDPVSLHLFVAVMAEGSIARAAEREHIAASALSRRLAELESRLNVTLFERNNRGTVPTAAAWALLHLARGVLNELDGIAAQMHEYGRGLRGQVRVVANISAITQFLPADLQQFLQRQPNVDVRLSERISTAVAQDVAQNAADIGILSNAAFIHTWRDKLQLLPYRHDELVLAVPTQHALAQRRSVRWAEVAGQEFVGAHPGSAINDLLIQASARCAQPLRFRIQVTGFDAMCLMVAAGLGVGVLPRGSAALYASALPITLLTLRESWAARELMLCVRAHDELSPAAQLLIEHLRSATSA